MKAPKLFGREPAVIVAVLQAAIVLLGDQLFKWSENEIIGVTAVVVVIGDGYIAWATHDTLLGVGVGAVKVLAACAGAFGAAIPPGLEPQLIVLVTTVAAFFQRTQTFPEADPPKPLAGATAVSEVGTR